MANKVGRISLRRWCIGGGARARADKVLALEPDLHARSPLCGQRLVRRDSRRLEDWRDEQLAICRYAWSTLVDRIVGRDSSPRRAVRSPRVEF